MDHPDVLVVDGNAARRGGLLEGLARVGLTGYSAESWEVARRTVASRPVSVVVLRSDAPGVPAVDAALDTIHASRPDCVVVCAGVDGDPEELLAVGAFDVVSADADVDRLVRSTRMARDHARALAALSRLRAGGRSSDVAVTPVGSSASMERLRDRIDHAARDVAPVLLIGETGTGRTLAARAIHAASERADGPFVVVHVTAFPEERLDSELFGVFDEATGSRIGGAIAAATHGTLFLDEIASVPLALSDRVRDAILAADGGVRWIASTTHDVEREAAVGRFDPAVLSAFRRHLIRVPPLREHLDDLPALARHFLSSIAEVNRLPQLRPSPDVLRLLASYGWPGNVRELRNALEQAAILTSGERVTVSDLPERIVESAGGDSGEVVVRAGTKFRDAKQAVVARFERDFLTALMTRNGGNVTVAAQESGMLRSALQRLLRKHGLRSSDFRGRGPRRRTDRGVPRTTD